MWAFRSFNPHVTMTRCRARGIRAESLTIVRPPCAILHRTGFYSTVSRGSTYISVVPPPRPRRRVRLDVLPLSNPSLSAPCWSMSSIVVGGYRKIGVWRPSIHKMAQLSLGRGAMHAHLFRYRPFKDTESIIRRTFAFCVSRHDQTPKFRFSNQALVFGMVIT